MDSYRLSDLIDIPKLQATLDSLYEATGIPSAIIDAEDVSVQTSSGWQDICVRFHRVHPETEARCRKSDTFIAEKIQEGEKYVLYRCANGLIDIAIPLVVAGKHLGTVFTGQMFLEPPDPEFFRAQARQFGFDEQEYMEALRKVPVIGEARLKKIMSFLSLFAEMLADLSAKHLDRLQAERTLRESEQKYRSVVDNIGIGIALISPQMEIISMNKQMKIWYPAVDTDRRPLCYKSFNHPEQEEVCSYCPTAKTLKDGFIHEAITETPTAGGMRYYRVVASPLREYDAESKVSAAIEMVEDITDSRQVEEELRKHREHLEKLVAERTVEVMRSNAELQQFAYVASHDLQEPLRMVTSYLQLLERRYRDRLDEDARDFIAFAVDGAARMQGLIEGLLSYSRIGTRGKEFAPTDLERVFVGAIRNLEAAIAENGAVITHDPLPALMADEQQLLQLFQNLLANAIKFRGDKPPQIHVGVKNEGEKWIFSVADNGIGFAMKDAERIFQIFQRLHTRQEYPGTGIGLSLAKKIVARHGGRIWAEAEPGQGAIFFFTLPIKG